jgi:endonuclease G
MLKPLVFFGALALSCAVLAQPSRCPEHFANGEAPEFINQKLAVKSAALCYSAYAVMHSGVSRTPLWSAEQLTTARLVASKQMKRKNTFHAEERLPPDQRAELHDYARSGFDRGHMSPSGDMPDAEAQYESFSLANMVPQNADNNQKLWSAIENAVRDLARARGQLFVITGPVFEGNAVQRLNQRVLIPTHVFKAIYDPAARSAGAYFAPNSPGGAYEVISIAELEKRSGMNLFPQLDARTKHAGMRLPEPGKRVQVLR